MAGSDRKDERRSRRFASRIPARLAQGAMSVDGTTLDVSRHGVFVETAKPPRERFLLRVALDLPDGPLEANAFVVRRVGPEAGLQPGVGLQFFAMGSDARDRWDRFVGALSGAAQPGGLDAPIASFVVKLGDEDKLRAFVARAQASGAVYMVTPLVRPVGTAAAVILVHPTTHRELMLGGTVARVRLEAPKGIELRLTPMTPVEVEALENFVDGARWDGLTPLPHEWIDDGTPPPDDALTASPMAFDLGSLGAELPEPTALTPEQQFAWSQVDAGAVLDVDLSDVDADGGLTDVLRSLGVRVTSTPGEPVLPEFTIDAGDELVALPATQPPVEAPWASRSPTPAAWSTASAAGGWAHDGTPLPSVALGGPTGVAWTQGGAAWAQGAGAPEPHPTLDAWSRLAPPPDLTGDASHTPSLDIPLTEPTEVTAKSLALDLAREDARAQALRGGFGGTLPPEASGPVGPALPSGSGGFILTPGAAEPTTRDVSLDPPPAGARPEIVVRSVSTDLDAAPREPSLVRSSLPRPASVDLPSWSSTGSADLRGAARGASAGLVVPAARRTASLPRLGHGSDDLGARGLRPSGGGLVGSIGSSPGDPITRDMQAQRTGSIPSARRVSVDREEARERRLTRSSAPAPVGSSAARPQTGDVRGPELALRARIPASPTPTSDEGARRSGDVGSGGGSGGGSGAAESRPGDGGGLVAVGVPVPLGGATTGGFAGESPAGGSAIGGPGGVLGLASMRRAAAQVAPGEPLQRPLPTAPGSPRAPRLGSNVGEGSAVGAGAGARSGESIDIELDDDLDTLARAAFDAIPTTRERTEQDGGEAYVDAASPPGLDRGAATAVAADAAAAEFSARAPEALGSALADALGSAARFTASAPARVEPVPMGSLEAAEALGSALADALGSAARFTVSAPARVEPAPMGLLEAADRPHAAPSTVSAPTSPAADRVGSTDVWAEPSSAQRTASAPEGLEAEGTDRPEGPRAARTSVPPADATRSTSAAPAQPTDLPDDARRLAEPTPGGASAEPIAREPPAPAVELDPTARAPFVPIDAWAETLPVGALEPAATVELACLQCDHTSQLLVGQPTGARGVFSRYRTYECRACRGFVSVVRPSATADRLRLRDALRGTPHVVVPPEALVELVTAMAELALPAHCPTCGGVLRSTKSSRAVERALPRVRAEATLALGGTPCPRCDRPTLALGDSTLRPVDPPQAEATERPSWDRTHPEDGEPAE